MHHSSTLSLFPISLYTPYTTFHHSSPLFTFSPPANHLCATIYHISLPYLPLIYNISSHPFCTTLHLSFVFPSLLFKYNTFNISPPFAPLFTSLSLPPYFNPSPFCTTFHHSLFLPSLSSLTNQLAPLPLNHHSSPFLLSPHVALVDL